MPGRQVINNTAVNPDTPKTASDKLNAMTAELYDNHIALIDSGTANAKVVAMTVAPQAYYEGMHFTFINLVANTGAATVNVNNLGVKAIKKQDGTDLASGDLVAGGVYEIIYKGAAFIILNLGGGGSSGLTANQLAAIQGANSPSGGNVFATMADVGGGSSVLPAGKIVTGWIKNSWVDPNVHFIVAAGTKVVFDTPNNYGTITLVAGDHSFLPANYGVQHYLWCDVNGTLFFGTSIPAGFFVILATEFWVVQRPLLPTIHWEHDAGQPEQYYNFPEYIDFADAADFGFVGDGVTNNDVPMDRFRLVSYWLRKRLKVTFYFKNGTYLLGATNTYLMSNTEIVGESKANAILKGIAETTGIQLKHARSITFDDVIVGDGNTVYETATQFRHTFVDSKFKSSSNNAAFYHVHIGYSSMNSDVEFYDCTFEFGTIYAALFLNLVRSAIIKNNTFTGNAWHNIRTNPSQEMALGRFEYMNNRVSGGATGIFFGSNRGAPVENIIVENNTLLNQAEECISLDGFGNNAGLCPTICNGPITSVSNTVSGRLEVVANMVYHDGVTPNQPSPLSLRNDWTKFYFSFGEGSGLEGVIAKIVAFDNVTNKLTLDLYTPAANVTVGGDCGVQAGFFNCVVRNNKIVGSVGLNNNYATAISMYLNVFGCKVEGNEISGCHHGINVAGGLMLSTYRTLAYNNIVKNNLFLACNQVAGGEEAVRFISYFDDPTHYGNQFINNNVVGGRIKIHKQQNFIFDQNNIVGVTLTLSKCGNVLPTANASQVGKRFMKITDDVNGVPTDITYYVCKLVASVYSWVEV